MMSPADQELLEALQKQKQEAEEYCMGRLEPLRPPEGDELERIMLMCRTWLVAFGEGRIGSIPLFERRMQSCVLVADSLPEELSRLKHWIAGYVNPLLYHASKTDKPVLQNEAVRRVDAEIDAYLGAIARAWNARYTLYEMRVRPLGIHMVPVALKMSLQAGMLQ